jgi:hypothetical protein
MAQTAQASVRIDTRDPSRWRREGEVLVCDLFSGDAERVWLRRLPADARFTVGRAEGAELLVVEGSLLRLSPRGIMGR